MKDQFESAKRELEGILSREWSLRGSAPDERRSQLRQIYPDDTDAEIEDKLTWGNPYYFRKEAPEFRTRGTNQMILGLDKGYVGKTRLYIERKRQRRRCGRQTFRIFVKWSRIETTINWFLKNFTRNL